MPNPLLQRTAARQAHRGVPARMARVSFERSSKAALTVRPGHAAILVSKIHRNISRAMMTAKAMDSKPSAGCTLGGRVEGSYGFLSTLLCSPMLRRR